MSWRVSITELVEKSLTFHITINVQASNEGNLHEIRAEIDRIVVRADAQAGGR